MSKHTPEPWNYNDDMQFSKLHEGAIILKREDAIHAFKCVNACVGFSDPELVIRWMKSVTVKDGYMPDFGAVLKEMEQLKAERDELLAALEDIAQLHPKDSAGRVACFAIARKKALETLDKLKGGQL
jgi:hypothetical protein